MANPLLLHAATRVAAYLMSALWQVPLLFVAGWLVARLLRRMGPAAEHRVWEITLLLCVFVPALPAPAARGGSAVAVTLTDGEATSSITAITHSSLAWGGPIWMSPGELGWVCGLWFITVLYGAVRLGLAMRYTRRLRSRASICSLPPAYAAAWQDCLDRAGLEGVAMLASPQLSGPATVSLGGHAVLLPARLVEQVSVDDFLAAVAHECAHIVRNDFRNNVLFGLIALPVAFHPVTRLVRRYLVATREMACDRAAAELLGNAPEYRGALLRLATWMARTKAPQQTLAIGAAVGIFDSNSLEERMKRLTANMTATSTFTRYALTIAAVVFFGTVTFAAAAAAVRVAPAVAIGPANVSPAPTPTATPNPEPATAPATDRPVSSATQQPHPKPATTAQKVYTMAEVTAPKLVYQVDPEFPPVFHTPEFWQGECVVGLVVDAKGVPQDVHIVQSLDGGFDDKAMAAVRQYRFAPATHKGQPVSVALKVSVDFRKF